MSKFKVGGTMKLHITLALLALVICCITLTGYAPWLLIAWYWGIVCVKWIREGKNER